MNKPGLCVIAFDPLVRDMSVVDALLGYKLHSLQMVKTAWGGSWSASLRLDANQVDVEDWIINGLGRQVKIYNDGGRATWSGFVSGVDAGIGALSVGHGSLLDTVSNKVKVIFSTVDYSVTPPAVGMRSDTAWATNADSQSLYGVIELIKSVGGCATGEPEQIRDVVLAEGAFPKPKETDNLGSQSATSIALSCLGNIHWLKAYTYNSTTTGEVNASTKIKSILAADPNGIISTDYSYIETNTTQVGAWENDDVEAFSLIKGIANLGDSSNNRWLFYLDAEDRAHYHAAPTMPLYKRQLGDPSQYVRLLAGGAVIYNWNIEPGQWVLYTDLMPQAANVFGNDPRRLFIEQMTFSLPYSTTLEGGRTDRLDQILARMGLAGGVT